MAWLGAAKNKPAMITVTDTGLTIVSDVGSVYALSDCVTLGNGTIRVHSLSELQSAILYGSAPGDLYISISDNALHYVSTLRSYAIDGITQDIAA